MRALILSDVHANLEALIAVLAAAAGTYDELWNLGDLVGYGGSPNQVVELLRSRQTLVVRGNHDRVCSGSASLTHFNPTARAAALWTRQELTEENRAWLFELPKGPIAPDVRLPGQETPIAARCVHGSPLNEDQYILNMRDAWAPLQQMEAPITFFGHTHVQGGFAQREHEWHELRPRFDTAEGAQTSAKSARNGLRHPPRLKGEADASTGNGAQSWTLPLEPGTRHLINPGSVGQPRDLDWRAAYALFDADHATVTFHRVPYDLVASQGRILMAGLPERLAERLREGR